MHVAFEIWRKAFDRHKAVEALRDGLHGASRISGTTVIQVVAVDTGGHNVPNALVGNCLANSLGLTLAGLSELGEVLMAQKLYAPVQVMPSSMTVPVL